MPFRDLCRAAEAAPQLITIGQDSDDWELINFYEKKESHHT